MKGLDGLLKCYDHEVSFDTPEEFHIHRTEVAHTYSGSTKCQDCKGSNIPFDEEEEQIVGDPMHHGSAMCNDCFEKIKKKIARMEKKK